jgi:hypothetical protein
MLTTRHQMEIRAASLYSGAHADDVDHVSWNPTHPELFVSSSQKDRKIVFWDARRELPNPKPTYPSDSVPTRKPIYPTAFSETHADTNRIRTRWKDDILCIRWTFTILPRAREESWGNQGYLEDSGGGENSEIATINLDTASHRTLSGCSVVRSVQSCRGRNCGILPLRTYFARFRLPRFNNTRKPSRSCGRLHCDGPGSQGEIHRVRGARFHRESV